MAESVRPQGAFICTLHECLCLATRSGNRIGSSTTIHALGIHLKRGFLLGQRRLDRIGKAGPRTTNPAGCFSLASEARGALFRTWEVRSGAGP